MKKRLDFKSNKLIVDGTEAIKKDVQIYWDSIFTAYRGSIPTYILEEMVEDVLETADVERYNSSDIELAFQRVLIKNIGIEL